tara:strand:+ start:598 stop:2166 length:1569 start_codon:yes stop_codon:yes gene_type:complete
MNEINWPKIDSEHLIVYSKQITEIEENTFLRGMPVESLMEKVGLTISNWLLKRKALLEKGVIVCIGPGHNGGDGAVIARELFLKGYAVSIWCPFPIKKKLTAQHINYITSIGVKKLNSPPEPINKNLWIDAILGAQQIRSIDNEIINLFNEKFDNGLGKIISIDVPTGLCPNTGKVFKESAIKSDYTLSIGVKKIGILQDTAIPYVGKIIHIDVGFTKNQLPIGTNLSLSVSRKDIRTIMLFSPPKLASKYKRGRTLLITGSEKYLGAASLVIKGALASGVGCVKALVPKVIAKSIWQVAPEVIVESYLRSSINGNSLLYDSLKDIDLSRFDSIVVGPGIGIDVLDWEKCLVPLQNFKGTLILDADALNRISESENGSQFFLEREFQTWITPHLIEFQRLFPDLKKLNNIELAKQASRKFNISILLKGAHSIVADPSGKIWQLYETDENSARAGLGDLLSGFIAGMSASELSSGKLISTESFAKYVFIHSFAAYNCKSGSNASKIGGELSKLVRQIKLGEMS